MRTSAALLWLALVSPAVAQPLSAEATAKDWVNADVEPRQAWAAQYASGRNWLSQQQSASMIETCLDHITNDEDDKIPKNVSAEDLFVLTLWCKNKTDSEIPDMDATGQRPSFRYEYPD